MSFRTVTARIIPLLVCVLAATDSNDHDSSTKNQFQFEAPEPNGKGCSCCSTRPERWPAPTTVGGERIAPCAVIGYPINNDRQWLVSLS